MNHYDAFSHSEGCDKLFSGPIVLHPCYQYLISGKPHVPLVDMPELWQSHGKCSCWCHNTEYLFSSPEPEYDLSPPPEYANSADLAFVLDEPAHVRVGFSEALSGNQVEGNDYKHLTEHQDTQATAYMSAFPVAEPEPYGPNNPRELAHLPGVDIFTGPANKAGFTNWSRQELRSGKCETCGDALADCECVE